MSTIKTDSNHKFSPNCQFFNVQIKSITILPVRIMLPLTAGFQIFTKSRCNVPDL